MLELEAYNVLFSPPLSTGFMSLSGTLFSTYKAQASHYIGFRERTCINNFYLRTETSTYGVNVSQFTAQLQVDIERSAGVKS